MIVGRATLVVNAATIRQWCQIGLADDGDGELTVLSVQELDDGRFGIELHDTDTLPKVDADEVKP